MNVIEKKRTNGRGVRPKVRKPVRGPAEQKPASLVVAVDGQLMEVERTFTARWEW